MTITVTDLGKNSFVVSYDPKSKFIDVINQVLDKLSSCGYNKIDEDSNGNWIVFKKQAYDGTSYVVRFNLGDGKSKIAVELAEDWDKTNKKFKNLCVISQYRQDDLNGNQRFDSNYGGSLYFFVSDKWLCILSKVNDVYGDYRWNSATGIFEFERINKNDTPDKYPYIPVCYINIGLLSGCFEYNGKFKDYDGNTYNNPKHLWRVGFVKILTQNKGIVSDYDHYRDSVSNSVYIMRPVYDPGDWYFGWDDPISHMKPALHLRPCTYDYPHGRIYGLKQIRGRFASQLDIAVLKCDKDYFLDDNGTDTEHYILKNSKTGHRFAIPR